MTKRSVENDIADVGEEVLRGLSPDDRLRLLIESHAEDRDEWIDKLHETTPKHDYRAKDHNVSNRVRYAYILAQHAAYDLWTAWLRYHWMLSESVFERVSDLFDLPKASDHFDEEQQMDYDAQIMSKVMEMYVDYHTFARFAEEVLDVDLETWLTSMHHDGDHIVPAVKEVLEMEQATIDKLREEIPEIGELLNEHMDDGHDYATSLEETVDHEYEGLCESWSEIPAATGQVGVR